jgi:hypothetical protein
VGREKELLDALVEAIAPLSLGRLEVLTGIVEAFAADLEVAVDPDSDFANDAFAQAFGDRLLIHHTLSRENFTKDKFEHGLEATLQIIGVPANLAARGNPGHDMTVRDERWSLKTQAERNIKEDRIHISKFMELGRGKWHSEADLPGLRDRMFEHMKGYDRIFTLRALSAATPNDPFYRYELVEIPKSLLQKAAGVPCVMHHRSRQNPKPGACTVVEDGELLFELYFDGGTERKLQVRQLAKAACRVHATWRFPRGALPA